MVLRQTPVPEAADLDGLGQAGDTSVMVHVPVGRHQVVQMVAASQVPEHVDNAFGIPVLKTRPARVDQDRLLLGRHDQCRRATHHINEVDVQRPRPGIVPSCESRQENQDRQART